MFPAEEIGMAVWSTEGLYLPKILLLELLFPEMFNITVTFLKGEGKSPHL